MKQERSDRLGWKFKREAEKPTLYSVLRISAGRSFTRMGNYLAHGKLLEKNKSPSALTGAGVVFRCQQNQLHFKEMSSLS